jgi:PAS domain-containing protein
MRDEHRPKQELIHEIASLRKQVVDDAPIGLCLFRRDCTLLTANRPFARLLGYDSPAELQAIGAVLGFFATPEEQSRALGGTQGTVGRIEQAFFRTKEGCRRAHALIAAESAEQQAVVVAVFDQLLSFRYPAA